MLCKNTNRLQKLSNQSIIQYQVNILKTTFINDCKSCLSWPGKTPNDKIFVQKDFLLTYL